MNQKIFQFANLPKAPGDRPESIERHADVAICEQAFCYRICEHRQNQMRIRCKNAYGEINTRKSLYG